MNINNLSASILIGSALLLGGCTTVETVSVDRVVYDPGYSNDYVYSVGYYNNRPYWGNNYYYYNAAYPWNGNGYLSTVFYNGY